MTTTSTHPETRAAHRSTVRIPTASADEIEAWLYRPEGDGPHPAVVLAHGFAAVKAGGLAPFAEAFRRQGFAAIPFDYRHWGGSSGEPRDVTSVPAQRADYRTVIDWAIAHPDIDETRVFVWGTSFSGLHAVELAATDDRLRGAIAQNPLVDGLAGTRMSRPGQLLHLLAVGVQDEVGSLLGRPPRYIPAGVAPGKFGAIANDQAFGGLEIIRPKDGTEWQNRVAARSILGIAAHRPVRKAADIRCPILLVVGQNDTIAPASPALTVAERAPKSELYRSRGGHYDVYEGGEDYDNTVRVEVEFLRRHAGLPADPVAAPRPA
ncbi:MAG TPA: alpha/beta fold hydrolase [Solirubrobacterales bacterium]